jgi:hypothetical protein
MCAQRSFAVRTWPYQPDMIRLLVHDRGQRQGCADFVEKVAE